MAERRKPTRSPLTELVRNHGRYYTSPFFADALGVSIHTWRHILCGNRKLTKDKVPLLAEVLGVTQKAVREAADATFKEGP